MDGPPLPVTRTRTVRPSARLRQSPQPTLLSIPLKPIIPQNVILHHDDATSKVFAAIAKAFLSVDNKAMTIKDLSDMTLRCGLLCQNVSAASQAITTYLRAHMQRCDAQQDQPLLLKHVLSGTAADDQLLPALHSRSGGAHVDPSTSTSSSEPARLTNFRRGTVVWYLSRVTGAPCPFARAGISLANFADLASKDTYYKKRKEARIRQEQCGEKRKRRSSRGCVLKQPSDDRPSSPLSSTTSSDDEEYDSDSSQALSDDDKPPPAKVKLTLKLPPLAQVVAGNRSRSVSAQAKEIIDLSKDSDDEYDDGDPASPVEPRLDDSCLPPYPRRSISIPPYTPCTDYTSYPIYSHFPLLHNSVDIPASSMNIFRRSPSVPYSVASPPPDSDEDIESMAQPEEDDVMAVDEDDDLPQSVSDDLNDDEDDFSDNWDEEDEEHSEHSTSWESPGPRSPSAPPLFVPASAVSPMGPIKVKEEPRDVQGLLDQWEDELDVGLEAKAPVSLPSIPHSDTLVKVEESYPYPLGWDWDLEATVSNSSSPSSSVSPPVPLTRIKQEDDLADMSLSFSGPAFTAWRQSSSSQNEDLLSPVTPASGYLPFSCELSLSAMPPSEGDAFPVSPLSPGAWEHSPPIRPRARTVPSLSLDGSGSFLTHPTPETPRRPPHTYTAPVDTHSLSSLVHSLSMGSPTVSFAPLSMADRFDVNLQTPPPCVSPSEIRKVCRDETAVVVTTCDPCVPQVCATHIEGIAVYQSSLGPYTLLRRIDTDFVNLTPVCNFARIAQPVCKSIPGATLVTKGQEEIRGLWVPLDAARKYVKDLPANSPLCAALDIFFADELVELFPSALRQFVWKTRESITNGPLMGQFGKSFGEEQATTSSLSTSSHPPNPTLIAAAAAAKGSEPSPSLPSSGFTSATMIGVSVHAPSPVDVPLSATEEQIFSELCVNLEWEKEVEGADGVETTLSSSSQSSSTSSQSSASSLLHSLSSRTRRRRSRVQQSPSPPSSPLSSCPSSPELDRAILPAHSSTRAPDSPAADTNCSTLRRSKRVANAIAARSRTRSIKRGSRNLS